MVYYTFESERWVSEDSKDILWYVKTPPKEEYRNLYFFDVEEFYE